MKARLFIVLSAGIFGGSAFFLGGCDLLPPSGRQVLQRIVDRSGFLGSELTGQQGSQPSPGPLVSPRFASQATEGSSTERAAAKAKANAEILHEMLQVIFMREPKDRSEFGNWTDTLNQGASLEGVFNGLTHSTDYRKLEASTSGAPPQALTVFAQELAMLEGELPELTQFDAESHAEGGGPQELREFPPSPSPQVLAGIYTRLFVGSSLFTLKRVISEEALKVVASKSQYREKLAFWFSKWAVHMTQKNVDFGVSLRNKPDEAFHYNWAMNSDEDRIKWEVLNRLQRILNDANGRK